MSDVKRILEIMGYKVGKTISEQKKIILETYLRKFTNEMADLLINLSSETNYIVQDLITRGKSLESLSSFKNLKDKLNSWSKTQGKNFDEQIDILNREIDNAGVGVGKLTDNEARAWDDLLNDSWVNIIKYIDNLNNIEYRLDWWSKMGNLNASEAIKIIRQIDSPGFDAKSLTLDELKQLRANIDNLTNIFNSFNVTYPYGKFKTDIVDELKRVREKLNTGSKKENSFQSILSRIIPTEGMANLIYNLNKWILTYKYEKNPKALSERIQKLSDKITEEINKVGSEGSIDVLMNEFDELTQLIFTFKREVGQDMEVQLKKLVEEKVVSKEILNFFEQQKAKGYDNLWSVWNKEWDEMMKNSEVRKTVESFGGRAFGDEWNAFKEVLAFNPITIWATLIFKSGRENFAKNFKTGLQRTGWVILWNDPRFPKELVTLRNLKGTELKYMIGGKLLSHLCFRIVVIPAVMTLFETFAEFLLDQLTIATGGKFDFVEFGYSDFGEEWTLADQVIRNFKSWLPDEWENFEDGMTGSEIAQDLLLFWTNVDNLIIELNRIGNKYASTTEKIEKNREEIQKEIDEIKRMIEDLKKDGSNLENDPRYQDLLKQLKEYEKQLNDQENDENDGGTESGGGEQEQGPIVPGLESEMKTAFNNWAASNENMSPQWISFSNNTGKVKIDGTEKTVQELSSGRIVIVGTNPLIYLK